MTTRSSSDYCSEPAQRGTPLVIIGDDAADSDATQAQRPPPTPAVVWCHVLVYASLLLGLIAVASWFLWDFLHIRDDREITKMVEKDLSSLGRGAERMMACSWADQKHKTALYLAMSKGFAYIHIDVVLSTITGTAALMLGQNEHKLRKGRTLSGTYLRNLEKILDNRNIGNPPGQWNGTWGREGEELDLIINIQNQPLETYNQLLLELEPLRSKGYLTSYDQGSKTWAPGALKIIGTGSTPLSSIIESSPRQIFYDAPLFNITDPITLPNGTSISWDHTIAGIASGWLRHDWRDLLSRSISFSTEELKAIISIQSALQPAKRFGIPSRHLDLFDMSSCRTCRPWAATKATGVDVMNVTELKDFSSWLYRWLYDPGDL